MSQTLTLPLPANDLPQTAANLATLDQLPKGSHARIEAIEADDSFGGNDSQVSQRLKELGFLPGASLRVIGFGLFGHDPIAVHVNGTKFALRRAEARIIRISPIINA